MSWANELVPPRLSLRAISADLLADWRIYQRERVPFRDRLVFLFLRVSQRIAYNLGWNNGIRRKRELVRTTNGLSDSSATGRGRGRTTP